MKCILWKNGTCTCEMDDFAAETVKRKVACYVPKSVWREYLKLSRSKEPKALNQLRLLKEKHLKI